MNNPTIEIVWDAECASCHAHIERGAMIAKEATLCSRCLNTAARLLHEAAANANRAERMLGNVLCK